jgi:hypothetical protein
LGRNARHPEGNSYSYEEESPPVDVLHRPSLSWQVDHFIQTQHLIGDASFHCRSYAQRLMTAVAATAKEQAAQIQKVSAQLEVSKPATRVVNNP